MHLALSKIDLAIVACYLLAVMILGLWISKATKDTDDLFLAGRNLKWPAIGFSLFASNISSTTIIGLAGAAYEWGIAVANFEWMAAIVLVVFCFTLLPLLVRSRVSTIPEFLEYRYGRICRTYFSGLTLFTTLFVDTAGILFAGAMVVRVFFPEIGIYEACFLLSAFGGVYTAIGGLAAVVYTDILQAIILFSGCSMVAYLSYEKVGFSWTMVESVVEPEKLSLFLPISDPNLPWLGSIIGIPIIGFYFWCTNQFITQRILGAKTVQHARRGALFAGLLKLPVLFIMVLPGTMALTFVPNLENGDMVFPTLIRELLPLGIRGIVLAGLLSAIISSIDSTLNSAATLVTLDFIKPKYPHLSSKQTVWIGRAAILIFMVVSSLAAPQIANFSGIFKYLQTMLAYFVPPVVVLFTVGVFWKRATSKSGYLTLLVGHGLSVVLFLFTEVLGILPQHFTINAGVIFILSSLVMIVESFRSPEEISKGQLRFTFDYALVRDKEGTPFVFDYRFLSGILLILTSLIVISFW